MLAKFSKDHDLWLLSDEVYDGQVWNGSHISPRALPGMAERTLVLNSLSKSHVMTGWRLGWIIGPPEAIQRLTDLSVATTYGVPGFVQDAGLAALTQGDAIEAALTETYRRRRGIALAALQGVNGVSCVPPDGAMYVMLDVRSTGLSGIAFAEELLDEANIAVMPGESFGQAAKGHVRVALTVEDSRLEAALKRIAGFAAARAAT
jgi:arginine:pyruvate transaminase